MSSASNLFWYLSSFGRSRFGSKFSAKFLYKRAILVPRIWVLVSIDVRLKIVLKRFDICLLETSRTYRNKQPYISPCLHLRILFYRAQIWVQGYFLIMIQLTAVTNVTRRAMITGIDFIVNEVLPEELTTHWKHLTAHYSFPTVSHCNEVNINGCKRGKHSPIYNWLPWLTNIMT